MARVEGADGLLRWCQHTATGAVRKVCRNGRKMPVIEAWARSLGGTPRARAGSANRLCDLSSQDKDAGRGDRSSDPATLGQHPGLHHSSNYPDHDSRAG